MSENLEIWHNPRCSKSRQTLAILTERGLEPTIIEYLKDPPTAARLEWVLEQLGERPRDLMRKKEALYKELGLRDSDHTDDELVAIMVEHPKLIERPVVIHGDRAAVGRPPEAIEAIL